MLHRTFFFRGKWQQFCNEIIDQLSIISMELFVSSYGFTSANACFISPLFGLLIYVTINDALLPSPNSICCFFFASFSCGLRTQTCVSTIEIPSRFDRKRVVPLHDKEVTNKTPIGFCMFQRSKKKLSFVNHV